MVTRECARVPIGDGGQCRVDPIRSQQGPHHISSQVGGVAQPVVAADRHLLILASASPRRLDLLRQIGVVPDRVDPPEIDETARSRELPVAHARRLADAKAAAVALRHPEAFVLAADTVVACGRRILPKAEDETTARRCLALLSGRRHRVLGGVCLRCPAPDGGGRILTRLVTTAVTMKRLEAAEIEGYLASGEWRGKAGGYAIQGRAAAFVAAVNGSYSNVVGLPLYETASLLHGAGIR